MIREPDSVRESARGQKCTVRLPGICNFDPETTVFAHVNGVRFGKGTAHKSNVGAYTCSGCHAYVDRLEGAQGVKGISADAVRIAFYEGVIETIQIMLEKGILIYG